MFLIIFRKFVQFVFFHAEGFDYFYAAQDFLHSTADIGDFFSFLSAEFLDLFADFYYNNKG